MIRAALFALACLALATPAFASTPQMEQVDLNGNHTTCNQTAYMTASGSSAILIPHVAGLNTYICGFAFNLGLVATTTAKLAWGTGTTCGTGTVSASPLLSVGTTVTGADNTIAFGVGVGYADSSSSVGTLDYCLVITGSAVVNGIVRYTQF